MPFSKSISSAVSAFISAHGETMLLELLDDQPRKEDVETLTIIADQTIHKIPDEQKIGTVYEFSSGQIDVTSNSSVEDHLSVCLGKLFEILRSKNWKRVRVVVSGHALLPMHIKLLVYRVLHLETEDIGYFGDKGYRTVKINFRRDVVAL